MYPDEKAIQILHRKYAPSEELLQLVTTHCHIVWEIAQQLIQKKELTLNTELVKAGSLLHDIGTYKYLSLAKEHGEAHYYKHAYEGAKILQSEHLSKDLCAVVEHHLGVGLTKEQIIQRHMDLPQQDFTPQTIEERIVLYADKFHSKTPKFNTVETHRSFVHTFGDDAVDRFDKLAEEFGIPELEKLSLQYNHPIL